MRCCKLCGKEFTDGQAKGGVFHDHLKKQHDMFLEDYVVLTEYNGTPPKCLCGYCDRRPVFKRGKFLNYAKGHNTYNWKKKKYIEIYGKPICKRPKCDNEVNFYRGKPNNYCSNRCYGLETGGFTKNEVQNKIKESVRQKYGVDNVIELNEVKNKQINSLKEVWDYNKKEILEKVRATKKERYGDESFVNSEKIKRTFIEKYGVENVSQLEENRRELSDRMIKDNPFHKVNVKTHRYKNTNLYYQSSYEYKFLEFCENRGILDKVENGRRFEYLNEDSDFGYFYLSDFIFDGRYVIEVKSEWIKQLQGGDEKIDAKRRCVESNGYGFILVMDNDLDEFIAKVL